MKFTLELPINKPRAEVWRAFDNPQNMNKWQRSLISFETISGTQGQPGAVSKLTFEERGRQFELIERVTHRDEPNRLDGVYENNFADNIVRNTFIEEGQDQTLWVVDTEFKFKTLMMRILGPIMKKNFVARTQKDMERFKEMVESQ
jgi:uncharacterized protein YndB with AHSA1/START domain